MYRICLEYYHRRCSLPSHWGNNSDDSHDTHAAAADDSAAVTVVGFLRCSRDQNDCDGYNGDMDSQWHCAASHDDDECENIDLNDYSYHLPVSIIDRISLVSQAEETAR